MDDAVHLSILAYPGPGYTPNEPMAFVAKFSGVDRGSSEAMQSEEGLSPSPEGPTPFETQYLYYRVYKPRGAVRSKRPAGSNNPFVGRISVDSFTPPHTATSIMRCISKAEELDNSKQSQLFTSISSKSPIGDGQVSILTSDRPGSTSDDPMAFVELPTPVAVPIPYPTFTKQIRLTHADASGDYDPKWLTTEKGEILRTTHEGPRNRPFVMNGTPYQCSAYEAVNDAGKVGFITASHVEPC